MTGPFSAPDSIDRGASKSVRRWLYLCCAMIFAMVMLGGITRLTGSGLSIVEWKAVAGILPPLGHGDWQELFAKYQGSPEFRKINPDIDLAGFQSIFWWEYLHRVWGRLIGAVVLLPLIWFWFRGRIDRPTALRIGAAFALGGVQGALGWYMVKSGLVDDPYVSPYRLAAHLLLAVLIYGYLLWAAFALGQPKKPRPAGTDSAAILARSASAFVVLVLVTMISGAFVAGLHAGLAYNTFPLMDGKFIPDDLLRLRPYWINAFENLVLVQFDHRVLAMTTLVAAVALWIWARRRLAPGASGRQAAGFLALAAAIQVTLGVATLLSFVALPLAALHQAMALAVFTAALRVCYRLRHGPIGGAR